MATRRAEVLFIGDASSLVRAAAESKAALDGVNSSANGKGLKALPQLGGNLTTALIGAVPAVLAFSGALGAVSASAVAAAGGLAAIDVGGIGALVAGFGSIALVAKPAVSNFQAVSKALTAYNLAAAKSGPLLAKVSAAQKAYNDAVAKNGASSSQAIAAHKALDTATQASTASQRTLNAVVSQSGGASTLNAVKSWNALGASFKKLTAPATSTLFSTFNAGLGTLKALLPTVASIANTSMAALSKALQGPLKTLSGGEFQGLLKAMGNTFSKSIGPGVDAVTKIFLAFSRIAKAAGPYVVALSKGVDDLGKKFANATKDPKTLSGEVGSLVSQTKAWLDLGGALTKLIFDVFKQGANDGKGLVTSLTQVVHKWDKWANSTKGTRDIGKFFQQSAQFVKQFFTAFAPVVQAFSVLSTGALPIYIGLMSRLSGIMGPLTYAFVGYKVALLATNVAIHAYSAAVTIAEGVTKVWAAVTTAWTAISKAAAIAMVTWTIATEGQSTATKIATVAQLAFDAAMDINPIVLAVTAIAALSAGIVYLATKTDFFQKAWKDIKSGFMDVAAFVKKWWPELLALSTLGMSLVVGYIVQHWGAIKSGTISVWSSISGFVKGTWNGIKSTASGIWNGITGTITGAISGAFSGVKTGVNAMQNWLSGAWATISGGVAGLAGNIKHGILIALQDAINIFIGFVNDIGKIIDKIPGAPKIHIDPINLTGGSTGGTAGPSPTKGSTTAGHGVPGHATGGMVKSPMYMVGEEAPAHPEVVIATNPAYRKRNVGLWAEAGKRLKIPGFATGGVVTASDYSGGRTASGANADTTVGWAELSNNYTAPLADLDFSALGNQPMGTELNITYGGKTVEAPKIDVGAGGPGLDGHIRAIDLTMPLAHELGFGGLGNVTVSPGVLGGKSILSKAAGAVGGLLADGAKALLNLLPSVGKVPSWLAGMGKTVLGDATKYIKDKALSLVGIGGVSNVGGGRSESIPKGASDAIAAAIGEANAIASHNYNYEWGGGHGAIGVPSHGTGHGSGPGVGFDCSGAVSAVLHALGVLQNPEIASDFMSFGLNGPGKQVSIFADSGHVFMSLLGHFFGTSTAENPGGGANWMPSMPESMPSVRHPLGFAKGGIPGERWQFDPSQLPSRDQARLKANPRSTLPGFAMGGLPFVGAFKDGGVVQADGMALVHKDETIIPAMPTVAQPKALVADDLKIGSAMALLAKLLGPTGDYAKQAEKIGYYPSAWGVTNTLLGADAPSFITSPTDAAGNPLPPFVDSVDLGTTRDQEGQELGWYASQVTDIKQGLPVSARIAPTIQKAIGLDKGLIAQIKKYLAQLVTSVKLEIAGEIKAAKDAAARQIEAAKAAAQAQIEKMRKQIRDNLQAKAGLQKQINKERSANEPFPNAKNKSQRAANAAFKQKQHDDIYGSDGNGGWTAQIASFEKQNRVLGGDETQVGSSGQIGDVSSKLTKKVTDLQRGRDNQIKGLQNTQTRQIKVLQKQATGQENPITKQITALLADYADVTGAGQYSSVTLQGLTGVGGELGPALLQKATLAQNLASISTTAIQAALASATQTYQQGLATGTTTSPTSPTSPTTTPPAAATGSTTAAGLAALLNGMPALAANQSVPFGGARATGGPVNSGYAYTVGEHGTETFIPNGPGTILNASQTKQGNGPSVNIEHFHAHSASEARRFANQIAFRAAIGTA